MNLDFSDPRRQVFSRRGPINCRMLKNIMIAYLIKTDYHDLVQQRRFKVTQYDMSPKMGKTLGKTQTECGFESQYSTQDNITVHLVLHNVTLKYNIGTELYIGAPKGFGDLGRMAIYFQGPGEHW